MTQLILSITVLCIVTIQLCSATPLIAEPPKEISTNEANSLVEPNMQKKASFSIPLTAEATSYRRGPMTRKAVYDPVKNITHIWDMKRGSYDLRGDHTRSRNNGNRRRYQEDDYSE